MTATRSSSLYLSPVREKGEAESQVRGTHFFPGVRLGRERLVRAEEERVVTREGSVMDM